MVFSLVKGLVWPKDWQATTNPSSLPTAKVVDFHWLVETASTLYQWCRRLMRLCKTTNTVATTQPAWQQYKPPSPKHHCRSNKSEVVIPYPGNLQLCKILPGHCRRSWDLRRSWQWYFDESERSNYTKVNTPFSRHTTTHHSLITGVSIQTCELGDGKNDSRQSRSICCKQDKFKMGHDN